MARGGAPSEIRAAQAELGRKDVLVRAPAAVLEMGKIRGTSIEPGADVSDKDIIAMQKTMIRQLESELEKQKISASTIAVTTCALIKAICDGTGVGVSDDSDHTVEIPKSLYMHLEGSELEISGIQQDSVSPVYARIVRKSNAPLIGGRE